MEFKEILLSDLRNGNLAILTGAGISVSQPAGFPLANNISKKILNILTSSAGFPLGECVLNEIIKRTQMERLWESVDRASNNGILGTIPMLEKGKPNLDHHFVLKLSQKFNINTIFTLNFDNYLEEAFLQCNGAISNLSETSQPYISRLKKNSDSYLEIVHLHGRNDSGDINSLATTISTTGVTLEKEKEDILLSSIKDKSIICLGYSNGDYDTFPLIDRFCEKVYWYDYKHGLSQNVYELVREYPEKYLLLNDEKGIGISKFLENCINDDADWQAIKDLVSSQKDIKEADLFCHFELAFLPLLGSNEGHRRLTSQVALETLFHDIGFSDMEDTIRKKINSKPTQKKYYAYYTHNVVQSEYAKKNKKVFRSVLHSLRAYIHTPSDYALLDVVGSLIVLWKIFPIPLWIIKKLCELTISLVIRRGEAQSVQKGFFLLGDINHFIAETCFCPSTDAIYRGFKHLVFRNSKTFHLLDRLCFLLTKPLRNIFLKSALKEYSNAVLFPYVNSGVKVNIAYNLLAALRVREVSAALGHSDVDDRIEKVSEDALIFYIQQKENDGQANCYASSGIKNYYSGNSEDAKIKLKKAYGLYSKHSSGKSKSESFLFRLGVNGD